MQAAKAADSQRRNLTVVAMGASDETSNLGRQRRSGAYYEVA